MTDGTVLSLEYLLKVKATATGGATSTKDVKVTIIVCGSETLTHPTQATYAKTLDIGASATPFDVDLTALFTSSDTYCPVKTYHLKTTDTTLALSTDPSTADALNYYLSGSTMKLFAKKDAVYNFYIYALSASGALVTMPAALTVQCVGASQTVSLATAGALTLSVTKNQSPFVQSLITASSV